MEEHQTDGKNAAIRVGNEEAVVKKKKKLEQYIHFTKPHFSQKKIFEMYKAFLKRAS